ncbi:MAG TPA: metalloregulator ArsR/SmtB family transcription factor [Gemmatimonadales bacterium]|nr:metalloregulator ArsR/SmtB family transcription factor [Gemmatimonadales bacterium]
MRARTADPARLTPGQFDRIAKALADPRRFGLLEAIAENDECPYQKLCQEFPVSKATISHHMKELVRAGLVDAQRDGQQMHATIRADVLEAYTRELARRLQIGSAQTR